MSRAYLKIENPGVADPTAFTLLGASTSRSSENGQTIGKFGSGNKHGVAVCLRNDAPPIIFAGSLRMTFDTTDVQVDTGLKKKTFARVCVKYGGRDRNGVQKSAREDLGFVLEYGAEDWANMDLALREFVSNAIDRSIEEGENAFLWKWSLDRGITSPEESNEGLRKQCGDDLIEYRKTARDWNNVTIEVVNENQVRAKEGTTRVFVPLTDEVYAFYQNLGKWFLHFSEPNLISQTILPKKDRNLNGRKAAVIYRRGVRVREFESSDTPSLFDYNINDLGMDESRKVDDWRVRHAAARAIRDAASDVLAALIMSFDGPDKYWEHGFDNYGLEVETWNDTPATKAAREAAWQGAVKTVMGDTGVLAVKGTLEGDIASRKGYKPVRVPEAYAKAANGYGIKTVSKVLSKDDREGRLVRDADSAAIAAVDFAWNLVELSGTANGREKPSVKVFDKILETTTQVRGFYRDDTVFLNSELTGDESHQQQLRATALEEVVYHVTKTTEQSRAFQDYLLNLIVAVKS